jgi:hypothetical protein
MLVLIVFLAAEDQRGLTAQMTFEAGHFERAAFHSSTSGCAEIGPPRLAEAAAGNSANARPHTSGARERAVLNERP